MQSAVSSEEKEEDLEQIVDVENNGKEKISKEDAIDLLKTGLSPEDILECYSGLVNDNLVVLKHI